MATVFVDTGDSGDAGYVVLKPTVKYILFLKYAADDVAKRGYSGMRGTFYRVYGVWQGAVQITGETVPGSANSFCTRGRMHERYGRINAFREDFRATVDEMSRALSEPLDETGLAVVRKMREIGVLAAKAAESGAKDGEDVVFGGYPVEERRQSKSVSLYNTMRETADPAERTKFANRLQFLAVMAADVAAFAQDMIGRKPLASSPSTVPTSAVEIGK